MLRYLVIVVILIITVVNILTKSAVPRVYKIQHNCESTFTLLRVLLGLTSAMTTYTTVYTL